MFIITIFDSTCMCIHPHIGSETVIHYPTWTYAVTISLDRQSFYLQTHTTQSRSILCTFRWCPIIAFMLGFRGWLVWIFSWGVTLGVGIACTLPRPLAWFSRIRMTFYLSSRSWHVRTAVRHRPHSTRRFRYATRLPFALGRVFIMPLEKCQIQVTLKLLVFSDSVPVLSRGTILSAAGS